KLQQNGEPSPFQKYTFHEAWPMTMLDQDLGYDQENNLELSISFAYTTWTTVIDVGAATFQKLGLADGSLGPSPNVPGDADIAALPSIDTSKLPE
ncbi:hypothetical protein RZS08_34695, partial [Arthrospira platensis SPKY1]|nr:hypothetical protein [Arthrospira platensis SPKY1]